MIETNSNDSSKRLVKILVIVGIGIPVIVELMTLFNLINVQIFENEKEATHEEKVVSETTGFVEGDSLFTEYGAPLVIKKLRVNVSAQEWVFELQLSSSDSVSIKGSQIEVDSLLLKSEKMISGDQMRSWVIKSRQPLVIDAQWELPNGDIPQKLFVRSMQKMGGDTASWIQEEVPLSKIPVRYSRQ